MVNRSKNKGTATETAVVRFLRDNGFPYAERRALAGSTDLGDITGVPGIAWEVKYAGSGVKMGEWMKETLQEQQNCSADYGILVVKPGGVGAVNIHRWYTVLTDEQFMRLWVQGQPQHRLRLLDDPVQSFTTGPLHTDFLDVRNAAGAGELASLLRRPPGTKKTPELWYRILSLQDAVILLRAAGYGTPLEVETDAGAGSD